MICFVVHSKLHNITLKATKVHVIVRTFVVISWMCSSEILAILTIITNDDNANHMSRDLNSLVVHFNAINS